MKFLPRFKKDYRMNKGPFTFKNPFPAFTNWFETAVKEEVDIEPNAMSISTVNQ
jgi:pyridoxine/pyridoxamine 5'-phosphate oxidase